MTHLELCFSNLLGALHCNEVRKINHHTETGMSLMSTLTFCVMSNEWGCLVTSHICLLWEMALQCSWENNVGKGRSSLLETFWCARLPGYAFRTILTKNLKLSFIFPSMLLSRSWSQPGKKCTGLGRAQRLKAVPSKEIWQWKTQLTT